MWVGVKEDGERRWEARVGGEEGMKSKDKKNGELQMRQPFSLLNDQLPLGACCPLCRACMLIFYCRQVVLVLVNCITH